MNDATKTKEQLLEELVACDQERQQQAAVLNNINEVIYVADPDTYELLYVNNAFKQIWGDAVGQKCYKVLQDLDTPCSFCTNDRIFNNKGEPYIWEFQNQVSKGWFRCIDRAIPWPDGREVRYEMAIDITKQKQAEAEREKLQQEIIEVQRQAIAELSTPVIPIMDRIIVLPLVGILDSVRARDITRSLLAGIRQYRARVVILDVTGVSIMDTGIINHLNKTIQAARLKGARTIVTGISDAVAESIVDLGIDWSGIETVSNLQTGLVVALSSLGIGLTVNKD